MKSLSENLTLFYVAGSGGGYGSGHLRRGEIIVEALCLEGVKCVLMKSGESPSGGIEPDVVVLDSRDDKFPGWLRGFSKKKIVLVAVDNRGAGRDEADVVWDALPHFSMDGVEFRRAIQNCILPGVIRREEAGAINSSIRILSKKDAFAMEAEDCLIHYPPGERKNVPSSDFQAQLLGASIVITYFGQTFFEALYLGKTIILYSISEYHRLLADAFVHSWSADSKIPFLLDGLGVERFVQMVQDKAKF